MMKPSEAGHADEDARPDSDSLVRDIVVSQPSSRQVLERHGIDYCCGGDRPLAEAVAAAGVDLESVLDDIEAAERSSVGDPEPERQWAQSTLTELAEHIELTHHVYMRDALPRLSTLFPRVLEAHGDRHGAMLRDVQSTFADLHRRISPHLDAEEQELFPRIHSLEQVPQETSGQYPEKQSDLAEMIGQLRSEHEHAGASLARMRSLTHDYALPEDGCPTFAALFEGLEEMEADLHQHIHLENNILYPRAMALTGSGTHTDRD